MRFHSRFILGVWFLAIAGFPSLLCAQSPAPPSLGAAASFAVLGGSSVTSTGPTIVTGNLGVSPGNTITGSPTVKIGATYRNDSVARQAQRDATTAYNDLAGRSCTRVLTSPELSGLMLEPGVYCFSSSSAQLTGTLILDALNDPNAVWIFRIGGSLTTRISTSVLVVNGGHESNIFWQVGDSAILSADTAFLGNVLALKDITLGNGASVSGRLLAQGAVSLNSNNVSLCCDPITLAPTTLPNGTTGTPYLTTTITASGGLGMYAFSVSSGKLPDGLKLNNPIPGAISGTPTKTGIFAFTITTTDSRGCTGTQAYTIAVSCRTITVTNPVTTMGVAGVFFSQTFMQSGAIGMATFTTESALPAGLSPLSTGGVLSGTPTQTGLFPIIVKVTDSNACTATGPTYNLDISCQTITVMAASPLTPNGTVLMPFSQQFSQTGAIGGATFTTTSKLPAGLSPFLTGGLLSGTPTQTGTYQIVVTVTDGNGCIGTSPPFVLTIGCQTITVLNPATTTGTVSSPFSQTFTQVGGIGTTTFATTSTLPAGLSPLSPGGVLSGTPTQTGTFPIVVTATDSNGCTGTGSTYPLTINAAACAVTLSPATLPTAVPGIPYNEVITASGGTSPYTFILNGTLPPGLTFNATTATISGTPTTVGCYTFTVDVTDFNGCSTSITYTICVAVGGPTLSGWSMIVLSILLVAAGFVMMQRGGIA